MVNCRFKINSQSCSKYSFRILNDVFQGMGTQDKTCQIVAGVEFRWSWGTAILALEKFELMRAPQQFQ